MTLESRTSRARPALVAAEVDGGEVELTVERAGGHAIESVAFCDVDGLQERVVPEGAALDDEAVDAAAASHHREVPEIREGLQRVGLYLGELVQADMKGSETIGNEWRRVTDRGFTTFSRSLAMDES